MLDIHFRGWWVRSVIIWSKPNPMPESVTDRPTESHEYILMLTKSARYYWDADAVRETSIDPESYSGRRPCNIASIGKVDPDNYKFMGSVDDNGKLRFGMTYPNRNIRSVWEFPTQPYPEAHFAVFPEKLPELCIKAATPEMGSCAKCGSPWERQSESHIEFSQKVHHGTKYGGEGQFQNQAANRHRDGHIPGVRVSKTLGWQLTCKCNTTLPPVPSVVLDPFNGAGTTLWEAKKLNRKAIGFDISEEYCELAVERIRQQVML